MSGVGFRIQNLWAYLAIHSDGDEGVVAVLGPGNTWVPAIGADMTRVRQLEPEVRRLVEQAKLPVVLAQFSVRADLERIEP